MKIKKTYTKNSLVVQWLGLHSSTAGSTGSVLCWETKILRALQRGKKKKKSHLYYIISKVELRNIHQILYLIIEYVIFIHVDENWPCNGSKVEL